MAPWKTNPMSQNNIPGEKCSEMTRSSKSAKTQSAPEQYTGREKHRLVVVAECMSQPHEKRKKKARRAREEPKRPSWKHHTGRGIEDTSANSGTEITDKREPPKTREPEQTERHTKGQTDEETRRQEKERKQAGGNHQPEEGTKSPARPEDPLTESGERRRIARAFSL